MNAIALHPGDLLVASLLLLVEMGFSLLLNWGFFRGLLVAAVRLVVQLVAVGFVLKYVFAVQSPVLTLIVVTAMALVAAREVAARPSRSLMGWENYAVSAGAVVGPTLLASLLALMTAIRPTPWYEPRYAIPLVGILLGSVLNAGSIALDSLLSGAETESPGIEARLMAGHTYWDAMSGLTRNSIRRGMLPLINQMSAAGIVTLPGIMTGQMLAGMPPMDAVKYQILLMFMLSGAGVLTATTVTYGAAWRLTDDRQRLRLDKLRSKAQR